MGKNLEFTPMSFNDIVKSRREHRDTPAQKYEAMYGDVQKMLRSKDPVDVALVAEANANLDYLNTKRQRSPEDHQAMYNLMRTKGVPSGQVAYDPMLSDISVQYANEEYIGTELLPVVGVMTKGAKYYEYPQGERHGYPDDKLGPDGQVKEISETRVQRNVACATYGLGNRVGGETLQEQVAPLNELIDMVAAINEGLAFKQEQRHAVLMQDAANYATSNKFTIASGEKWDSTGGGEPVKKIKAAITALWTGRGPSEIVGWCGRDVFDVLCQHPGILELFKFTKGGLATPEMIASILGMDKLLVGSARQDTANEGQGAPTYNRIWSNNFGIARVARTRSIRNASFGYTFRVDGDPVTQEWFNPELGKSGSWHAKVAFDADYKVVAADTGTLIINPLT